MNLAPMTIINQWENVRCGSLYWQQRLFGEGACRDFIKGLRK